MLRRLQKIICVLAIALMITSTVSPAMAKSVQARVNTSSAKVYKKASRSSKSKKVKKGVKLKVTAVSGNWAKVKVKGKTGYMPKIPHRRQQVQIKEKQHLLEIKVVKMDWFKGGNNVLKKGHYGTIYAIDTGISLRIKRMGGHYHADVEPATAADTAKLKRVAGGHFSWGSEAVILKAGGKYVACGINTKPHGDQTIYNNNYDGQFCLHMSGSKTHASSKENDHHQSSIDRAYRWAQVRASCVAPDPQEAGEG